MKAIYTLQSIGNAQLYMSNYVHLWHCQYVSRRCVTVKQDPTEVSTGIVLLSNRTQQRCQQALCYCQTGPNRGVNVSMPKNVSIYCSPESSLKVPGFARLSLDGRSIKMKMSKEHRWNDTVRGKTAVFGDKPVQIPLYLPQIAQKRRVVLLSVSCVLLGPNREQIYL
jgi:hypothetical protein